MREPRSAAPRTGAPRVVMVVNNGMVNDARVLKSAHTLTRAGADVVVLGVASPGRERQEAWAGGVRFVRLPFVPARGVTPAYVRWALARRLGRLAKAAHWRRSLPVTRYYARAFAPELRRLAPDVVHVHDVHLLACVHEAFGGSPGRPAVIYDAHEYVASLAVSGARTQRVVDGWASLERDHVGLADRVITVSPAIADRIREDSGLASRPAVVYNAPLVWPTPRTSRDLRAEAGVGPDQTLVVYSGALSAARGVDTVVRALPDLPSVVLAVVAVPHPHPMAPALTSLARTLGVGQRLRFVPPVPSHEVPAYLGGADVGVSPIVGDSVSYDLALPNKLFEFVHAGLPIVTSDLAAMGEFVRAHGLGEVFRQGDARSCADAIRRVLATPPAPASPALRREYSWQGQEAVLVEVYRGLREHCAALAGLRVPTLAWSDEDLVPDFV